MSKLIGAHVSTAGGTHRAVQRAHNIGANVIQIFSGSPRSWRRAELSTIQTDKLFSEQIKYSVEKIYIHAQYLINLASLKPDLIEKSLNSLKYDLRFSSLIKASGVIVHVGSHLGAGWLQVREVVAQRIKEILVATPNDSFFLIENSAGQKGKVNSDLAEIRWLMDEVGNKRLRWCLDTCHGFSAGYSLADKSSKNGVEEGRGSLIKEITKYKLWSTLEVIHVNDSKGEFDGGIDRHENLGEGKIPTADLKAFLRHKKVKNIPLILEVPGLEKNGPDKANIERLEKLV